MISRLLKPLIILSAILLLTDCEEPEPFIVETFTKTIGSSETEFGESVQQTTDGGYIIVGYTYGYGAENTDAWLAKTDAAGDTMWVRIFRGDSWDYGRSVQQTTDGGYIITGGNRSVRIGLGFDLWLIKTNSAGDTAWTRIIGGNENDEGYSVQQTTDGGYIISGYSNSFGAGMDDVWLVKTDASGDTIWTRTFGGGSYDKGRSVQQTADGGYIIAGGTRSFGAGDMDIWLLKTDAAGYASWTRTFGGSDFDNGRSVQQTADGGYIIAGSTRSFGAGESDFWLIKTDASGDTLWTRTYGDSSSDVGYSVQQTSDNGYILTGWTASFGAGSADVWLVKTDISGDTLWTRTFGGSGSEDGFSVQQTTDEGYVIGAITTSYGAGDYDIWLIKTDEYGNVE